MRPASNKYYNIIDLSFKHVVVLVLNDYLNPKERSSLSMTSKAFNKVVVEFPRLMKVDWRPLLLPRLNYQSQSKIDINRVDMATALALRCGLDPGKNVRTLNGEFTAEHRDVKKVLSAVAPVVSIEDFNQIRRILCEGCPHSLKYQELNSSKSKIMARGNQKNFVANPDFVTKTINKEDKNSHLIPMHHWICDFGPNLRHNPQGIIIKPDPNTNPRVVWDGSTKHDPNDVVLNEVTSMEHEAEVTFGLTKLLSYQYLYNLRISFPEEVIYLALADVKACFRFPRIHPDLTGAFGFLVHDFYCLAVAMVFGSNTSASSWEPFRRAIEELSKVFMKNPSLVGKHEKYLNMIKWEVPSSNSQKPIKAVKCDLNPGVLDSNGSQIFQQARIWVDDAMMAAVGVQQMKLTLAALIEAIFVVMGEPDETLRQCHLAMDK